MATPLGAHGAGLFAITRVAPSGDTHHRAILERRDVYVARAIERQSHQHLADPRHALRLSRMHAAQIHAIDEIHVARRRHEHPVQRAAGDEVGHATGAIAPAESSSRVRRACV